MPHLCRQRAFRMRLAWNLVITGAPEMDEDWIKILENSPSRQSQYQGKYQTGVTPSGNNTLSRQQGYVGKLYTLPAIRFSPGNHESRRYCSKQMRCIYCRYKKSTLQEEHQARRTRFGCSICGPQFPLCEDCHDSWHHSEGGHHFEGGHHSEGGHYSEERHQERQRKMDGGEYITGKRLNLEAKSCWKAGIPK